MEGYASLRSTNSPPSDTVLDTSSVGDRTGEDITNEYVLDDQTNYTASLDSTGVRKRSKPKPINSESQAGLISDDNSDEEDTLMDYDVLQEYRKRSRKKYYYCKVFTACLLTVCAALAVYYLCLVISKFTVVEQSEPNVNVMLGRPYTQQELDELRGKVCTNCAGIGATVGMPVPETTPYKPYGYETKIDYSVNCYVVYPDEEGDGSEYSLTEMTEVEALSANSTVHGLGTVFLTHTGPCGVCSSLDDLYVYLSTPDLTNPVRACGLKLDPQKQVECIENIGFSEACSWIWVHNTRNTKQSDAEGGCFGTCIIHITSDNNDASADGSLIAKVKNLFIEANPCDPDTCLNTINGNPACSPEQWQDGEYRLNACIACDECRSGPIFQKVSGRTRRNSGISSAITRPPGYISEVYHLYGNRRD
ncbi:hypothetical protein SARC_13757 [Sphaeroforma arctica JP610]|uniref:Uncharacterized protein n=1 Tax=Sphaeroforma arctica JP610 TaxID=667725 RepID=A0A0L0FAC0_9EUKA|nr:hypothetical protein SARC_13757 [Sphaeroforma arctica JP610]KNC73684.1 hypothetical protein SARC_13757 [Sphaeroforma arctica JP610]|eukprot:XP_014147586.1 hypothetical protein SARC_13757 [Sphaeroforma arctica JP610]